MKNDFKFFLPADIEKATDTSGKEVMKFKGIASTSEKDSQSEYLDPSGFDLDSFKFVNWNHLGSKDSATIIGEPTKAVINANNEFYVEGRLFPEVEMAKSTWNLMKALQNSKSGNKLGISVEGKALERACGPQFLDKDKKIKNPDFSKEKWNKIIKAKITSIALCPIPVNGGTWADIMKGEMHSDLEEEYDEDTKKAMTASDGDNVTQVDSLKSQEEAKKKLKKSEIFEIIYDQFPNITIEKAKSVYSLIEKTTIIMSTEKNQVEISEETIAKALDILNLASGEIIKSAAADKIKKDDSADEDDDNEMVEKAKTMCKSMASEKKDKEAMKAALLKKGYGEKVIEKAMADDMDNKKDNVAKSDIDDLLKSHTSQLASAFDEKFKALGTILKSVNDENLEIKKSLETSLGENKKLHEQISTFLKTPQSSKSIISKSYTNRFNESTEEGGGQSANIYNMNNSQDRIALRDRVTEISGINKGENFDVSLTNIAQEIEIAKSVSPQSLNRLKALNINVVSE